MNTPLPELTHEMAQTVLLLALRRHDLSKRERLIADWLVDTSYGWGRVSVLYPSLDTLGKLIGLQRSNVHLVVAALKAMQIVSTQDVPDGTLYTVNPDARQWKARPVQSAETVDETLRLVQELNRKHFGSHL